jgi:quercetin dioxygenase-like cupin family protein
MDVQDLVQRPSERARFGTAKMTKIDCFRSDRLLLGLNCFAPGQDQPTHTHADADKFYFVVSGKASFVLAGRTVQAQAGDLIVAPAGVAHGVDRVVERTVVLVGIAPAPAR